VSQNTIRRNYLKIIGLDPIEILGEKPKPKTLKEKLDFSVYDNLSCDYENEIIQRLLDLCENQDDLVKLSTKTSFPFIEEIENLHNVMLNYIN
jgi:hypothetical protein